MNGDKIIEALLGAKGVVGLLVAVLFTGYKEIWVWGKTHRQRCEQCKAECLSRQSELKQERDRWQTLALSTTSLAHDSAQILLAQKGPQ